MKTFSEADIRKMFKSQNYKYACLRNADGKTVVTFNTEANPKVKAIDKVNESFERLKILPDGLYTFQFANSKGRNVHPDEFGYLKGNMVLDQNGKSTPFHVIHNVPANATKNDYERVLSYPEVMKLQMELTSLSYQLTSTKEELAKANDTILSLEKDIAELEAKGLGEDASPTKWIEQVTTTLLPVADRYFNYKERELSLQEKGMRRPRPAKKKEQQRNRKPRLPEIGSEHFEQWLDKLADLSDEEYQQSMHNIKQASQKHYDAIVEALESDESEETL